MAGQSDNGCGLLIWLHAHTDDARFNQWSYGEPRLLVPHHAWIVHRCLLFLDIETKAIVFVTIVCRIYVADIVYIGGD